MLQNSKLKPHQRMTLYTFIVLLMLGLVITLWMILPYALSLIMGGILAQLSYPLYLKLRDQNVPSCLSSLLVTLGILMLVIIPLSMFVTLAVKQGISIGEDIASSNRFSSQSIFQRLSDWPFVENLIGSPEALQQQVWSWIRGMGKAMTTAVLGIAASIPQNILQIFLASIACFFFLVDGSKLSSWLNDKIPLESDVRRQIAQSFQNTAVSVIWATLATAFVQSTLMFISYLVLNIPSAFLAAGATFIFAWIPIIGSTPVWVTGIIYLYIQGDFVKAIFMLIFGLIIGVVDNFIRPLVLKGRGNLHTLVSLVSIFGGIGAFGIVGVFMGPILVAVVISILQIWPIVGQRYKVLPDAPAVITPLNSTRNGNKRSSLY